MSSPVVEWRSSFGVRSSLLQVLESRRDAYRQREQQQRQQQQLRQHVEAAGVLSRDGHWRHGDYGPGQACAQPTDPRDTRAGAARSLELMRDLLQPSISKDIKEVLDKYYERFFQPAVRSMKANFALRHSLPGAAPTPLGAAGYGSMVEEQLQLMLQHILEEAKLMYTVEPPRPRSPPSPRSFRNRRLHRRPPGVVGAAPATPATATAPPPAAGHAAAAAVAATVATARAPQLTPRPQQLPQQQQQQSQRSQPIQRVQLQHPQPLQPQPPRLQQPLPQGMQPPPPPPPQQRIQPPPSQPRSQQPQVVTATVTVAPAVSTASLTTASVATSAATPRPSPSPPTPAVALATLMTGTSGAANPPPAATLQQMFKRRKEMDAEAEARRKRARQSACFAKRQPVGPIGQPQPPGTASPDASQGVPGLRPASPARTAARVPQGNAPMTPTTPPGHPVNYLSPQWDPSRIAASTEFIMGARANKVLGYETSRGRLYTKHPELFKYPSDQEDREWLARNSLIQPTGGKAFVCVLRDVAGLAASQEYRNNPHVNLAELKGFRVPEFMLNKIRDYMSRLRTEPSGEAMERASGEAAGSPPAPATPSSEQHEGGILAIDSAPLVQLARPAPATASAAPQPTPGMAVLSLPTASKTSKAISKNSKASATVSAAVLLTTPRPVVPAVTTGFALTPGSMLTTLPPSLEALTPQQSTNPTSASAPTGAAAAAAAAVAAAAAAAAAVSPGAADVSVATASTATANPVSNVVLASAKPSIASKSAISSSKAATTEAGSDMTPKAVAVTAMEAAAVPRLTRLVGGLGGPTAGTALASSSSTPASPCGSVPCTAPPPRGLAIRSHSMPAGTFVVEPLVLDELELYIKETRAADEGCLDLNLEDVQLDVGAEGLGEGCEHGQLGQLELAWDFIGELHSPIPSPASPATSRLLSDQVSAGSAADGSTLMADPLADDVLVDDVTAEGVLGVRGLTADVMIGGDTSIVPDDLTMSQDEGAIAVRPSEVSPELGMEPGALAGTLVGTEAVHVHAVQQLELAQLAAASGSLDGPLDGSSLSMGHVTLSALLSGSVMEGLDIPEGLL